MKGRWLHLWLFFSGSCLAMAQQGFDNVVHLTPADGLPHRWVYDLEEDAQGFIWIGSYGGLCRFDGSNVLPVKHSGPPLRVRSLQCTGDSLWIGTFDGAFTFNLNNGQLEEYPIHEMLREHLPQDLENKMVRGLFQDRQGHIWMAPAYGGFVRIDPRSGKVDHFPLYWSEAIPAVHPLADHQSLLEIVQDVKHDSIFWGITYADLVKLNASNGQIERFRFEHPDEDLAYHINRPLCIHAHTDGKIYLGSWYRGLSIFDPATKRYAVPTVDFPENWMSELFLESLTGILPKNDRDLYLTYPSGLYLFNPEERSVKRIQKNNFSPLGNIIYSVSFRDSAGRLWSCLSRDGIHLFDPLTNQYQFLSVEEFNNSDDLFLPRGVIEDFYPGYLTLYGQYSDGLYHIDPASGHTFKTPVGEQYRAHRKYFHSWGAIPVSKDELVISEVQQLYYYKKNMPHIRPYGLQPPLKFGSINQIAFDWRNRLWLGSNPEGIWSIDPATREITDQTFHIGQFSISGLFRDQHKNVWFRFQKGHAVLPAGAEKPVVFAYEKDSTRTFRLVESFCECPNGEVWAAINTEGIGLLSGKDPGRGALRKIPLKDSLAAYPAFGIACDRRNNLWAQSSGHLLKVNRQDWSIEKYSFEYGLTRSSGLFQFLRSGKLLIGGREGVFLVDPDELRINESTPKPYVVRIKTNQGVRGNLEALLQREPLHLPYYENALTIDFSAINLTLPGRTRFQYRMLGVDEGWVDPEKNRSVIYTNLHGGDYVFQLRAANNEGLWSEQFYELPIFINEAWYESTYFFATLGLGLLGLVLGIYQYRISEIRREEKLRSEFELKIANIEMTALRAQMNPHFIFNCLNSIDRYIIRNDTRKASEYLNSFGRLIRLILQNSRANYVNLKDELEALELYIKLEQMRFHHSFDYEIRIAEGLNPESYEVPPMLIQPFVENAIWHGLNTKKSKGKVTISITRCDHAITCMVEDNGIGREAAQKIKNAKQIKRQSMGMHITSERIEVINKMFQTNNQIEIIDLYDQQGRAEGTRVILLIPL